MKIKDGFVVREVAGDFVAVPIGKRSKEFHGMIKLNQTSAFLFNFYQNNHSIVEGVEALTKEYNVDEKIAESDINQFLDSLNSANLLEVYDK